jgi:hypothetical protein
MAVREGGQASVLGALEEGELAVEDAPRRRSGEGLVSLVDGGQQLDVGHGVALREPVPAIGRHPHFAGGHVACDQPRHLRAAQSGDLLDMTPQQSAHGLAMPQGLLLAQHQLDPAVNLLTTLALKTKTLAGFDKPANRLQTQLLRFVHADLHLQQTTPTNLQAHLVLESIPAFRLILCWTRVTR